MAIWLHLLAHHPIVAEMPATIYNMTLKKIILEARYGSTGMWTVEIL